MHFEISFIFNKSDSTKKGLFDIFFQKFNLSEGENQESYFGKRKVIVFFVEDEDTDFDEICVSLSEQHFHREYFDSELKIFTNFVNQCFADDSNLKYALCSYELNGYLIGRINKIHDFDNNAFLKRFPIVYKRKATISFPFLETNTEAQEIFE